MALIITGLLLKRPTENDILPEATKAVAKDEEFEKDIEEYAKGLKLEENTFATGQFKVKKIVYPETTA